MQSQDREKEYEHNVWEIYRRELAIASPEKLIELNERMRRWQDLIKNGLTASQAYYRVMEEHSNIKAGPDKPSLHSRWPSMFNVPFVVLIVALVALVVYSVLVSIDRSALKNELDSVRSTLISTQAQLSSTQGQLNSANESLASAQAELGSTKQTLTSTQVELSSTKQTLISTQSELSSTQQTLASVQQASADLQATLSITQQQLAVAQETLEGLGITVGASSQCYDKDFITTGVGLVDNPTATNPTWSQLMTFLSQDQTEKHEYTIDVYDCSLFSRDAHNNAEARGIRAAEVSVWFRNERTGHALNAFLTTDYGLVYVDCIEAPDRVARVKAGKEYRSVSIDIVTGANVRNDYWWDSLSSYYYIPSSMWGDGEAVTSSIEIYW
jgi:DNA gyrase/topoisomerase IV subunit A